MHDISKQHLMEEIEQLKKELAAMHEQIMRYQADPQYDARFLDGQDKTLAAMKEQHSADLREIAKYAIRDRNECFGLPEEELDKVADSIVREFREKQQKSKGGDARESSKSSQPDQR